MLITAGHLSFGGIYTAPIAFNNTFAPIVVVTDECRMTTLANDFVNNQIMTYSQSSKLSKRAKKQALQGVARGPVHSANDRKFDDSNPGIFQTVLNKIGEVAHSILHTFAFLNQNFLKFPSAAATEMSSDEQGDILMETASHTKNTQVVPVNEKLMKILGDDVVFVDMPGLYDKRENPLESLVHFLLTKKSDL